MMHRNYSYTKMMKIIDVKIERCSNNSKYLGKKEATNTE